MHYFEVRFKIKAVSFQLKESLVLSLEFELLDDLMLWAFLTITVDPITYCWEVHPAFVYRVVLNYDASLTA